MKQFVWILFTVSALLLSGCIELQEEVGQPCTEEKFCENGLESVCGEDGVTYACPALALCEGVAIDSSGDACGEAPQCEDLQCLGDCEFGLKTDDQGCEICECNDAPTQSCGDDACVPFYCATVRGQCIRESELATMGACMTTSFQEPETQCVCTDEECAGRECRADADCGDGLCVLPTNGGQPGYCVNTTCEGLQETYNDTASRYVACEQDIECRGVATLPDCCGNRYVNSEGAQALGELDDYVLQTSCGQEWADFCAVVDCMPPQGESKCVQGVCQLSLD